MRKHPTMALILMLGVIASFVSSPAPEHSLPNRAQELKQILIQLFHAHGDDEEVERLMAEYRSVLERYPEIGGAIAKLDSVDKKLGYHKQSARDHFEQGRYQEAIAEYESCLQETSEHRGFFAGTRALILVEMGSCHLMLAEEKFNAALQESLPAHLERLVRARIAKQRRDHAQPDSTLSN